MTIVGRVIATGLIWIVGMIGVGSLINQFSTPVYEWVQQSAPDFNGVMQTFSMPVITGAEYAPGGTVIVLALLAFFLMAGMIASTLAMWTSSRDSAMASREAISRADGRTSQKLKRDQQVRLQRLLARMEADDLAALEHHLTAMENQVAIGSDGELVGLDETLYEQRASRQS